MKLIPNYTVSYKGTFHPAGIAFEIDDKDELEMAAHGRIEKDGPVPAAQPKRTGRPKRTSEQGG